MKTFNLGWQLIKRNMRAIIAFEFIYRLICIALLLPLLTLAFRLSLWLAGYRYLSEDRIFSYLLTPSTLAILSFLLFSISVITVYEVFCIIPAFHASYHKKRISVTQMFQHGFFCLLKCFSKKNLWIFLFTLLLIPLTNITILSGFVSSITIPDFILYYIRSQKWMFRTLLLLFALMFLASIPFCLSLHIFCLEPGDFFACAKRSRALIKKHYLRTLGGFFGWNFIILCFIAISAFLCLFLSMLVLSVFWPSSFNSPTLLFITKCILTVCFDFYAFFSVPIIFSLLSARFYMQKEKQSKRIFPYVPEKKGFFLKLSKRLILLSVLGVALLNLFYLKIAVDTDVFWNQNIIDTITITAHRGDSIHAPENSMKAFELAIENHADVIELDVQKTKDNVVVVVHDFNLHRICKRNVNVWELTYDELKDFDTSYVMKKEHPRTTIPTLEEVLTAYRGKVDFNIELKQSAHTTGLEKDVVSLIEKANCTDSCVVASRSLDSLKKVKFYQKELKTIYLLPLAYGNFDEMDFVDGVSVKSSFITRKLVNHIHDNGKVIYAWTVNNDSDMERMLHLGVDSLITDQPAKATEIYYAQQINPVITTWISQITGHKFFR